MNDSWNFTGPIRLDLGSGPRPLEGHLGIDQFDLPAVPGFHQGVRRWPLGDNTPWPLADDSVESLYSSHLIEHLPNESIDGKDVLAFFFEEAWRVALPLATFTLRWPSVIDEETGQWKASAFYDPTHRRFIPRQQLLYFSTQGRHHLGVQQYGFRCNWVLDSVGQRALTPDREILEYLAILHKEPLSG